MVGMTSLAPLRPVMVVLAIVEMVRIAAAYLAARMAMDGQAGVMAFDLTLIFRLLFTVGALVLLHNLYAGASRQSQAVLRWPATRLRPSRTVTFQTFSLLIIGGYLMAMVAVAQWLAYAGGDFARLVELAFLTVASVLAILVLPSRRCAAGCG
jgi:hypothetical protein